MSEDPVTSAGGTDGAALPGQDDRPVGALELFFDLVFVYAMSQVTNLMLADTSWVGFGHGALALAAIWWAWVCFAWLTGTSDEAGPWIRTLILLAMAAMLVTAIALPEVFGDHALTFGLAYLGVRLLHVVLFLRLSRRNPELRAAVGRLVPPAHRAGVRGGRRVRRFALSGVAVARRRPHRLRRPDHLRNGRMEGFAVLFRRAARERNSATESSTPAADVWGPNCRPDPLIAVVFGLSSYILQERESG